MAININNYVDLTTVWPSADAAQRAFGGLVVTASTGLDPELADDATAKALRKKYRDGELVYLTLDDVRTVFGEYENEQSDPKIHTPEYEMALHYYGYLSPSGRFASRMAFIKLDTNALTTLMKADAQPEIPGFGSVNFLDVIPRAEVDESSDSDGGLTPKQIAALQEVAQLNEGDKYRCKYLIVVNSPRDGRGADAIVKEESQFSKYKGVHYLTGNDDCSAYMPMAILGSTDFENGQVTNYMFKMFSGEEPVVTADSEFTTFNSNNVNYYGQTQTNGRTLSFYQRGYNTDGTETAIYCNEMWFKSSCESELMTLLTNRERIPANQTGVALVEQTVAQVCMKAVQNGAFMSKEILPADMKGMAEIVMSLGGTYQDAEKMATDIATNGYSIWAVLRRDASSTDVSKLGKSEPFIMYYVFYGTAESIRYIKGFDVLLKN